MESAVPELAVEPLSGELPEAVTFSPVRPAAAALDAIGAMPALAAEKVTLAPPSSWVVVRELESESPGAVRSNQCFLIDWQFHVEQHESHCRVVRKLDTMKVVQEASQWRMDFDPRHERLTIHSLAVMRGTQRNENAKLERLRILQREMGLEYHVIEGVLTVVVLLEDVRVGDTLDLSYSVQGKSPIFADHFSKWMTIPEQIPVRSYCLSARFRTGRAMRWKSNDPKVTPKITEEAGETLWSWQTGVVPANEMERNVPARESLGKWIQISDFASWGEVAAGLTSVWNEDLEDPKIVQLAESIAAEGGTPGQFVERALTFFQDEIRYLSVSGDLGGTVPAAPGLVVKRGFGDCKDKSFAAAHLLRRLGIPARPVIVHSILRDALRAFLPLPEAFNHAIVEYEIDGRRRWVDVTESLQGGTALTRPGASFEFGLPIGPDVRNLEPIAKDTESERLEVRETFYIDTSGRTSSLRVSLVAAGREAERWRRSIAETGVEDFARSREQYFQRIFPHAKRAGKLEWADDREQNEFCVGEVFDLHEFGSSDQERRHVQFRMSAHTIQGILGFHQIGKRQNSWALTFPCRIKHVIEIDSPNLRKPGAQTTRVEGDAFRFSAQWQGNQGQAVITFNLEVLKDSVPAKEFEAFKKDASEVWRLSSIVGNLPPGSSVAWKKRSAENLLPPKSRRPPMLPRGERFVPTEAVPLPATAPACASREFDATPLATGETATGVPRQRTAPVRESSLSVDRREVRRPNAIPAGQADGRERGATVLPNPPNGARGVPSPNGTRRPRGQRKKRRRRENITLWIGIVLGAAFLAAMFVFLVNRK